MMYGNVDLFITAFHRWRKQFPWHGASLRTKSKPGSDAQAEAARFIWGEKIQGLLAPAISD